MQLEYSRIEEKPFNYLDSYRTLCGQLTAPTCLPHCRYCRITATSTTTDSASAITEKIDLIEPESPPVNFKRMREKKSPVGKSDTTRSLACIKRPAPSDCANRTPKKFANLYPEEVESEKEKSARKSAYNVSTYRSAGSLPTALPKPGQVEKDYNRGNFCFWRAMYAKPNTRKNKVWEDQGLLVVEGSTVILQTSDGEEIGRSHHIKLDRLKPDALFNIGPKEVHVLEGLTKQEYQDELLGLS